MKRYLAVAVAVCAVVFGVRGTVMGQGGFGAHLSGVQEVPPTHSHAHGFALVSVDHDLSTASYTVVYFGLGSNVTQAHLHFGTPGVNGGIVAFLCSNLLGKPAGVQDCPTGPGFNTLAGTLTAADVGAGAAAQGIAAGNFEALADAIENSSVYVNVHTETFPGGEIRGPLGP